MSANILQKIVFVNIFHCFQEFSIFEKWGACFIVFIAFFYVFLKIEQDSKLNWSTGNIRQTNRFLLKRKWYVN